jgi:hypothetical protein
VSQPPSSQSDSDELADFLADLAFVMPNLNDTFSYACADSEKITVGDGKLMAEFWRKYGWQGLAAIAAVQRRKEPVAEVARDYGFIRAVAELHRRRPVDEDDWSYADEFEIPDAA